MDRIRIKETHSAISTQRDLPWQWRVAVGREAPLEEVIFQMMTLESRMNVHLASCFLKKFH